MNLVLLGYMFQCDIPDNGSQPFSKSFVVPQIAERGKGKDKGIVDKVMHGVLVFLCDFHAHTNHFGVVHRIYLVESLGIFRLGPLYDSVCLH